jgi:hypothetical protein
MVVVTISNPMFKGSHLLGLANNTFQGCLVSTETDLLSVNDLATTENSRESIGSSEHQLLGRVLLDRSSGVASCGNGEGLRMRREKEVSDHLWDSCALEDLVV